MLLSANLKSLNLPVSLCNLNFWRESVRHEIAEDSGLLMNVTSLHILFFHFKNEVKPSNYLTPSRITHD